MILSRATYLEENTLAVTPPKGYFENQNKSVSASIWLDWLEKSEGQPIAREQHIGDNYYADGFIYDPEIPEEKKVFEFWGCYFHGCPKCFPNRDRVIPQFNRTVEELYDERTKKKVISYN